MSRFSILMLKISALLSACGGPLVVMDSLKAALGDPLNFVVGFAPVGLAVMGTFSVTGDEHDVVARTFAWAGLFGVASVVGMNVHGAIQLLGGGARADRGLILLGILVGTASAVAYGVAFRRWRKNRDGGREVG